MKLFFIRLLSFCSLFFVIDKAFVVVRSQTSYREYDKRLEYILDGQMNKDLLILGSSRGARGIIAKQIQDSLGGSSFNLCYLNSNILFHEYLLKKIIKHNDKPKIVLLVIDGHEEFNNRLQFRTDRLIPLVNNQEIRQDLITLGEKNKILSSLFVLHQLYRSNFFFREKIITKSDSMLPCGSMPYKMKKPRKDLKYINCIIDDYDLKSEESYKIKSFTNFEKICIENNIKLMYVFPPNFYPLPKQFKTRFEKLTNKQTYIHYANEHEVVYKKQIYFKDDGHLNNNGAVIFTNELIKHLSNLGFVF
jgi:hypothetical protein